MLKNKKKLCNLIPNFEFWAFINLYKFIGSPKQNSSSDEGQYILLVNLKITSKNYPLIVQPWGRANY